MAIARAPIVIDGAYGEGGGALLRAVLALSALTQQSVCVEDVRGATKYPGLNGEDLTWLRPLALCCDAEVSEPVLRRPSICFAPRCRPKALRELVRVHDENDPTSFANALVVLNTLLPVLARSGAYSELVCQGETYGHNILTYDYFANVTLQALRRMGLFAYSDLSEAGFGRHSRGEVRLDIEPSATTGVEWTDRGELRVARAIVVTSDVSANVGERGVAHLVRMAKGIGLDLDAESFEVHAKEPGAFVTVWLEFERGMGGATAMGMRGVRIETIAQQAFDALHLWLKSGATADMHLADQILIAAALAEGETTFTVDRLTPRFLTTAWAIKQFLPIRLTVKGSEGQQGTVTIRR